MINKVWSTFLRAEMVVFAALMIIGAKINCRKHIKTPIADMNCKITQSAGFDMLALRSEVLRIIRSATAHNENVHKKLVAQDSCY